VKCTARLVLVLMLGELGVRGDAPTPAQPGAPAGVPVASRAHRTFTTDFPRTEQPISEGGNWECGKTLGVDWADVATKQGLAYGLESGTGGYDDSTALVTGPWGPNQTAEAIVHTVNQFDKATQEVELRLRSALSPHSATGYEINFSCMKNKDAYSEIVR
jgi:hypothetical protein